MGSIKDIEGKAEMRLSDMYMLMEKAKFYDEAYHKVNNCLQKALQEIVMSVGRTIKVSDPNIGVRVDGDSPEAIIDDIVNKNKILHMFIKVEDLKEVETDLQRPTIVIVIKTGFRENDQV